ncbi:tRNA (guanine-N(7)-)-methyltransferase (tRNA(m7G46)-methyltransferase) [Coemansia sp. RSA 2049]|nr:tRNA (guanine-N(7)-)-methyltransferase (tRNA(m7G46)-methyltransferase) [Coemansia sp. RSA 2049]
MAAEDTTTSNPQGPRLPQKRYFRQRAHVNVFNDMRLEYPVRPSEQDWSKFYPAYFPSTDQQQQQQHDDGDSGQSQQTKRPSSPATQIAGQPAPKRGPAATPSTADPSNSSNSPQQQQKQPSPPLAPKVEFADIGCGYGGLLVALSPLFPNTLMVGMEIRTKLVNYLQQRIEALRAFQHDMADRAAATGEQAEWVDVRSKLDQEIAALQTEPHPPSNTGTSEDDAELHDNGETHRLVPGHYDNIAAMRINCQKYLPNFFEKAQLSKIFILFADPHFKRRKHKARIISSTMLAEYAYALRVGGIVYTITDVKDLHDWNVKHLDAFPLFQRIPDGELENDPAIPCVVNSTEEGKKVARNKGDKYLACYRRIDDPAEQ